MVWYEKDHRSGGFWGVPIKKRLARQVEHIRHWKVYNCSYEDCPITGTATWFIDPPYQNMGKYYKFGSTEIDYQELGSWCQSRDGQVIVCENDGADWLPFKPLAETKSARKGYTSKEIVWIQNK